MKNQDQPAYPVENLKEFDATGLTKRELLAAMAMQGLLANQQTEYYLRDCEPTKIPKQLAICSVESADALLAELDKENVCEWKWENARTYATSCKNFHSFYERGIEYNNFKTCPYCGRKIKEVK